MGPKPVDSNPTEILAVIPARYAAVRLPGKPLKDILGKPMIQWVYEGVTQGPHRSRLITRTVIATDDERIAEAARAFGAEVVMTSASLQSGTERVAAVAKQIPAKIYVNVQGDEPLMQGAAIDSAIELVRSQAFEMATLMSPLRTEEELKNPAVVKVISNQLGQAIYFSRHPIPYSREVGPAPGQPYLCRRHLGLYVFTPAMLKFFETTPPSLLERAESLEQLRALDAGRRIGVAEVDLLSIGVDTPEELEKARAELKKRGF